MPKDALVHVLEYKYSSDQNYITLITTVLDKVLGTDNVESTSYFRPPRRIIPIAGSDRNPIGFYVNSYQTDKFL